MGSMAGLKVHAVDLEVAAVSGEKRQDISTEKKRRGFDLVCHPQCLLLVHPVSLIASTHAALNKSDQQHMTSRSWQH
jgi:hypothetical protein